MAEPAEVERAFCINLDRRLEKWKAFSGRYSETDIAWPLERFSAVDGSAFSDAYARRVPSTVSSRISTRKGEIGCRASHARVLTGALDSGMAVAAVFEDDCYFAATDVMARLEAASGDVPDDWRVVMLGGRSYGGEFSRISEGLARCVCRVFQTHAYVVNVRRAARDLSRLMAVVGMPADAAMVYEQEAVGGYYILNPPPATQQPGESDVLGGERAYDGEEGYAKLRRLQVT